MDFRLLACSGMLLVAQLAGASAVVSDAYQISFTVPENFHPIEAAGRTIYAFVNGDPSDDQLDLVLAIETTGGRMPPQPISVPEFADARQAQGFAMVWKNLDVQGFYVYENAAGVRTVSCNIVLPLVPEALIIKVTGPRSRQEEVRTVANTFLDGFEGVPGWAEPVREVDPFSGLGNLMVFVLGVLVLMFTLSRWLLNKPKRPKS